MNDNIIQVLIVEDCEKDATLLLAKLQQKGYLPIHQRVETKEDFLAALQSRAWDAVISDYVLPHFSGPEALKSLRNLGFDTPFIMVSGVLGEEKAVTIMKAGANDYIMKGDLSRLVPALERELKAAQGRRRHKRAECAMLQHFAANIRELQNVVERALIVYGDNGMSEQEHFSPALINADPTPAAIAPIAPMDIEVVLGAVSISGEFPTLRELEKQHIFAALDRCKGNRNNAAKLLDMSARTLRNKLHEYNGTSPRSGNEKSAKT
jgi:DNA-binding NtrC family response regulator